MFRKGDVESLAKAWDGLGEEFVKECWLKTGHGQINLQNGLTQSCNVVFYEVAGFRRDGCIFVFGVTLGQSVRNHIVEKRNRNPCRAKQDIQGREGSLSSEWLVSFFTPSITPETLTLDGSRENEERSTEGKLA